MERAIILVGKEETEGKRIESYQLLINCSYISISYDGSNNRGSFYEEVSNDFVEAIVSKKSALEVGACNGLKIDTQTGDHVKILKLEDELASQFMEKVTTKLKKKAITIPISTSIN